MGLSEVVFRGKPQRKKDASFDHARLRSPRKRAITQLKNWDVLRQLRCCPHRVGEVIQAVLILQLREAGRKALARGRQAKILS